MSPSSHSSKSSRSSGWGSRKSSIRAKYTGYGARVASGYVSNSTSSSRSKVLRKVKGKSKTKTKKKMTKKVKVDGPISESSFKWPKAISSFSLGKFKKLTAPQIFVTNQTFRLSAGIGIQGFTAATVPTIWSVQDLTSIFTQAAVLTATPVNVPNPKTQKVYLKSCRFELMMTNQTNDVVHCQIYECLARRDIFSGSNYSTPGQAWVQGCTDAGAGTVYNTVGSSPFQVPGFTEFFKVEKIIDVNIHSGAHHIHRTKSSPHAVLNDEIMQAVGSTQASVGHWTRFSMVIVHGYALNDSMTSTQISTAAVNIDLIWRKQYEFEVLERSTTQVTQVNNLPTSFTNAGQIQSDVVNAITAVTQA